MMAARKALAPHAPGTTVSNASIQEVEMRSPRFASALCMLVAYGWGAAALAEEPVSTTVWTTSFSKAQADAKRLQRPLVVHFYGTSCPPCRRMEKEVLNTPQVLKLLDKGFVAVKVDLSNVANSKLAKQYRVEAMPTDIVLGQDGKVLYRSEGYAGDRAKYVAALTTIDASKAADGARLPRTEATLVATQDQPKLKEAPPVVANAQGVVTRLVPEPVEPRLIGESAQPAPEAVPEKPAGEPETIVLALDGYCPVTLRTTRTWKKGSQQHAFAYDGQTFLFEAAEKREEFKANPTRYAPKLFGCDAVVLAENNLAIRGSTKFGAFYDGELFLFENAENRAKFRKEPARFVRLRHVLKPEDVKEAGDAKEARKLAVTAAN